MAADADVRDEGMRVRRMRQVSGRISLGCVPGMMARISHK